VCSSFVLSATASESGVILPEGTSALLDRAAGPGYNASGELRSPAGVSTGIFGQCPRLRVHLIELDEACSRQFKPVGRRPRGRGAHPSKRISSSGFALKKSISIEISPPIDSRSRYKTTTGRDNELFWTEKFIFDATAHSAARLAA
jgi:hypothetical protein